MQAATDPFVLQCRDRTVDARPGRVVVMGILNVTPDSFSDGGLYLDPGAASARVGEMLEQGAAIIDVGGASSRPAGRTYGAGANAVPVDEEVGRVVPVIRRLAREWPAAVISVDTVHAAVAGASLEAGAHIINDITALRHDPDMTGVVAEARAAVVLMHSVGAYGTLVHDGMKDDAVATVTRALAQARDHALAAGVRSVVLDPGFGFGKSPDQNLALIARTADLVALGHPVLVAVSRKSAIGVALESDDAPRPVDQRLHGSLAATAVAVAGGASIVRTHDVRETRDLATVVTRTLAAGGGPYPWSDVS